MARRQEPVEIKIVTVDMGKTGLFVATSVETGDLVGQMTFSLEAKVMTVPHTYVEGQGVAGKLTAFMIDYAKKKGYQVVPECSYVAVYFERHQDLVEGIWERNALVLIPRREGVGCHLLTVERKNHGISR